MKINFLYKTLAIPTEFIMKSGARYCRVCKAPPPLELYRELDQALNTPCDHARITAIIKKHFESLRVLFYINRGGSKKSLPDALCVLAAIGHVNGLNLLLQTATPEIRSSALKMAIQNGALSTMAQLLPDGIQLSPKDSSTALLHNNPEIARLLLQRRVVDSNWTFEFAVNNCLPSIIPLVANPENINALDSQGYTPLMRTLSHPEHTAYRKGRLCMVKTLLAAGAGLNAKDPTSGCTPLLLSIRKGFRVIANNLLDAGSDPHACDSQGVSVLATMIGHNMPYTLIRKLINLKNFDSASLLKLEGGGALHDALISKRFDVASMLLSYNCNPNTVRDGKTVLMKAIQQKSHLSLISKILDHPDFRSINYNDPRYNMSAFLLAISPSLINPNSDDLVALLIDKGACNESPSSSLLALLSTVSVPMPKTVSCLLAFPSINPNYSEGNIVLIEHAASKSATYPDLCSQLFKKGASIDICPPGGHYPIDYIHPTQVKTYIEFIQLGSPLTPHTQAIASTLPKGEARRILGGGTWTLRRQYTLAPRFNKTLRIVSLCMARSQHRRTLPRLSPFIRIHVFRALAINGTTLH